MYVRLNRSVASVLFAGFLLLACGDACDGGGGLQRAEPDINVTEDSIEFGLVRVGMASTTSLRVENIGSALLDLKEIYVAEGPYADWFTVSPRTDRVGIGSSREIEITFSPRDEEEAQALLVIEHNDDEKPTQEVMLYGTGFIPLVDVSPLRLDFGNVVLETSKKETVSLRNNGDEPANVLIRSVTGQGGTHYRVEPPAGATDGRFVLMPDESAVIDVTYAPTTRGRHLAAFTIEPCDGCMPAMLDLAGVGIDSGLIVEPTAIEYGAVNPGSPISRPVTFKNIGNRHVQIIGLTIVSLTGGEPSSAFWVDYDQLPFDLNEGDEVEIDVYFGPNDLQHHVAGLEWESTDNRNESGRIPLSGRGGGPDIELVPEVLSYGLVAVGAPMPRNLVILNNGFDRLEIYDIEILDEPAFSLVDPPGHVSLDVGDVFQVPIEFNPQEAGGHQGRVVVRSNDPDEPEATALLNGEAVDLPPCQFSVNPEEIRFGIVDRNRSRLQQFSVTNEGDDGEQCLIAVLDLEEGTPDVFELPGGQITGLLLEPAETIRVDVSFTPNRHGVFEGGVEFYVSHPDAPRQTVGLHGVSQAAGVLLAPDELDFGQVQVGCASREREIRVYNTGSSDITVMDIELTINGPDQDSFRIASVPPGLGGESGITVQPGGSVPFTVEFRPSEFGTQTATIEVTLAEFDDTFVVIMEGTGAAEAIQTDVFSQLSQPMADILLVIDDSCSMHPYQSALHDNLEDFMQFAIDQNIDYHIGIITTDARDSHGGGILRPLDGSRPRIITPRLPDPLGVFRESVMVGTSGDWIERGFRSAEKFFQPEYLNDPDKNAGFLRDEAHLAIVFISDEPEQSAHSVDYYLNLFRQVKGFRRPEMFTASSIVSNDSSCAINAPHFRYLEVQERTGGVFSSICSDDWAEDLRDLSSVAFGYRSRFNLTNFPVEGTIEVIVLRGGTDPVDAQYWEYDTENNAIQFDTLAIPEAGDVIEVTYEVQCLP